MRLWAPVAAGVLLEAAWLTLLTRRTGGFRVLVGWPHRPAVLTPRLGQPMKSFLGYSLHDADQGPSRLVRPAEHPQAVWIMARPRCVGSWRLAGILHRLTALEACPVPLVWVVGGPAENVERWTREVVPEEVAYRAHVLVFRAIRIPRTPFAFQVDEEGVVRQVGLVDTLPALMRFIEGCSTLLLQSWFDRCLAKEGVALRPRADPAHLGGPPRSSWNAV